MKCVSRISLTISISKLRGTLCLKKTSNYSKKAGLKITEPRLTILALMQDHKNEHFSAEDVYKILLEQGSDIGLATVYRVLNQFDEARILIRHNF